MVAATLATRPGVAAGIDWALWLVGGLSGPAHARTVRRYIQSHGGPSPPMGVPAEA